MAVFIFLALFSLVFVVRLIWLGTDFTSEPWKIIVPVCATMMASLLAYLARIMRVVRALKSQIDLMSRENDRLQEERITLAGEVGKLKRVQYGLELLEGGIKG